MTEIGEKMQSLQKETEVALRPLLASQFRAMADCMDAGGSQERIQGCMENAQRPVVNVQNKLDKVVSSFGQAMQAGMQKCQADAQQMMASGGVESGEPIPSNRITLVANRTGKIGSIRVKWARFVGSLRTEPNHEN